MFLTGLKVIRTRKRISRAKLSRDTGISIEDIKTALERIIIPSAEKKAKIGF